MKMESLNKELKFKEDNEEYLKNQIKSLNKILSIIKDVDKKYSPSSDNQKNNNKTNECCESEKIQSTDINVSESFQSFNSNNSLENLGFSSSIEALDLLQNSRLHTIFSNFFEKFLRLIKENKRLNLLLKEKHDELICSNEKNLKSESKISELKELIQKNNSENTLLRDKMREKEVEIELLSEKIFLKEKEIEKEKEKEKTIGFF
jgi:hypothetical protein